MRDLDIRRQLRRKLQRLHADDPSTVIVEELGVCVGSARADVAVLNGAIEAFEIKSERDTLARLDSQVAAYGKVFDRVTLVTEQPHAARAEAVIPEWWGIVIATDELGTISFTSIREPALNPSVSESDRASLLWREEVLEELELRDLASGIRSKPRRALWQRLASMLSSDELGHVVRERLKTRLSQQGRDLRE